MAGNREYFNRRLHSLLGVIPVGLFLTQHLVVNHFATKGEEAFNNAAHFMESLPFQIFLRNFHYLSYRCYTMQFMDFILLLQQKTM